MAISTPIASVASVIGKAFARNADGEIRELNTGDVVFEGEVLRGDIFFGTVIPV